MYLLVTVANILKFTDILRSSEIAYFGGENPYHLFSTIKQIYYIDMN